MPQMAPMNWLTLMLYFIILLTMFVIFNFYMQIKIKKNKTINQMIKTNWKW